VVRITEEAAGEEVCSVANFNSPEQTVIAGHAPAVERAMVLARQKGAKRAIPLPVSAPFHSALMAPARTGLEPDLAAARFSDPSLPVIVNIDAVEAVSATTARDALIRQIDGPVRWVETVRRLWHEHGVRRFVEVGPGALLSGLIRRIESEAETISLSEPAGLARLEEG
jgi:[acyl-carrier-protein] S-malonyltransferase